ncbi:MAG: 2-aminoethylphosphonate--pyruvate transaminase [Rhodothermales bacterium]
MQPTSETHAGDDRGKLLFTPGPLTTSRTVKDAMKVDLGSRDASFIAVVRDIRRRLLALDGLSQENGYEAVIVQGSGTFGIESVVGSVVPPDGKLLVVINGAYGTRIAHMARVLGIATEEQSCPEDETPDLAELDRRLAADPAITHVFVVHCETTTGILNPIREIGDIVRRHGKVYCVDAMSSFGAIPANMADAHIDFLVSSANKCIEGVPGFAFVLARREALLAIAGFARSLSLDLLAQWKGLEQNGQFRFTPPTHALLAFHQALLELEAEGGVAARGARYRGNHTLLIAEMSRLGFTVYLPAERQSFIITSFYYPTDPNFDFEVFYSRLSDLNYVIYPGKLSKADCFRIGNIGQIFPDDIRGLAGAIADTLEAMGVAAMAR